MRDDARRRTDRYDAATLAAALDAREGMASDDEQEREWQARLDLLARRILERRQGRRTA